MSIHFKRSYINRNPPLLKIPNYYSPIQHSQTSNNRFHSNIKIINTVLFYDLSNLLESVLQ